MPTKPDFLADAQPARDDFLADATPADQPQSQSPAPEGFWHSLGATFGITPEAAAGDQQDTMQHPVRSVLQHAFEAAIPAIQMGKGLYQGIKRESGEAGQAVNALREGNPYSALVHGVTALPFVGPAIDRGSDQLDPGQKLTKASFGTALGTAAQVAPMVLGAADTAFPTRPGLPPLGPAMRSAAIGDPDAAALRGLRVGAGSPRAISTIKAMQGARPFLQGAQSLEDVQARIPGAKSEIWGPYQKTIDAIGDKPVDGPDGPTTVRELETERQQLSAINRQLKSKIPNPEALKLAEQKGLNQAQMLQRERAVQNALDPVLRDAGIQPKAIRQAFGQVSQIGEKVSGKSTLAEAKQPYGLSKLQNVSLTKPLSNVPLAGDIARDIAAGRYWSAKPTDVALREAFRPNAAKPDFGAYQPQRQLGSGYQFGAPHLTKPTFTTPSPNAPRGFLPPQATEGEARPMLRYARPYLEPEPQGIRTPAPQKNLALPPKASAGEAGPYIAYRPTPPPGEMTRVIPSRLERLNMQQGAPSSSGVRGLLPAPFVPTPEPEPTLAHVFPAGSAFRGNPETPVYPPGSAFRAKVPKGFNFDEHLEGLSKAMKKKEQ
jgi:hypothetical protein